LYRRSRRAGVQKVYAHRFRHTFATEYLKNGGSPQMLQRILGHTTPLMTQRYVHITDTDAKKNHQIASPVERYGISRTTGTWGRK
jgi:integrase/recombinase XerD